LFKTEAFEHLTFYNEKLCFDFMSQEVFKYLINSYNIPISKEISICQKLLTFRGQTSVSEQSVAEGRS
jgi:hypothetical protein